MDVKPGYKQTDVGVIPEDWEIAALASIGAFSKGQGIRKDEAESGDIPAVRYGELYTHHNDIIRSFNSWIARDVARSSRRLRRGDLMFAGSGETKEEIGKCAAFIVDEEAYAGGDIIILSPDRGDSTFLGYLLNAPIVARQKASKGQGDAIVHVSASALASLRIPLPPTLAEQQAIAEALGDVDALISALDRLIAKKRAIKQGAMQELLTGRRRLPGFGEEWSTIALRDMLVYERPDPYIVKSTEYSEQGDIPVLTANKSFILGYTNEDFGICTNTPAIVFDDFTTDSKYADFPFKVKSSAIKLLRPKPNQADLRYVFALMQLFRFPVGDHKRYYISEYQHLAFDVPSFLEQTAIATVLSDIDAEIAALEQRRDKTRLLKQGMMQELLTGRIRLIGTSAPTAA